MLTGTSHVTIRHIGLAASLNCVAVGPIYVITVFFSEIIFSKVYQIEYIFDLLFLLPPFLGSLHVTSSSASTQRG